MTSKKFKTNFMLLGFVSLIVLIYSYFLSTNKGSKKIEDGIQISNQPNNLDLESGITKFANVEYNSTDNKNRAYRTQAKQAFLNKKKPDLILLKTVKSTTTLKDGSDLIIMSDNAKYFKNSKNIEYMSNVKIINKEISITAELAKFIPSKNIIRLEKNVVLKDINNTIKGDIVELDTLTNDLQIFMNNKKNKVYGQRKQKN